MAIFPFFREISFAAFLISGILGSVNYYKSGNLDQKTAGVLSAGSFVGALAGAPGRTWHRCLCRKQNATKINQTLLKRIVAVASIAIACIKLFL